MSKAIIVLVEPQALDRDCLLQTFSRSDELTLHAVADPLGLAELVAAGCPMEAIVVSIGERSLRSKPVVQQLLQIGAAAPDAALMVLSAHDDIGEVLEALQFGLRGYLTKSMGFEMMLYAIRFVCAGGTFVPASALRSAYGPRNPVQSSDDASANWARPALGTLTPRQAEVLHWLRKGLANKAIAYKLRIREGTVKAHVQTIMKKVGAANRTQAVHLTSRDDVSSPPLWSGAAAWSAPAVRIASLGEHSAETHRCASVAAGRLGAAEPHRDRK